MSLRHPPPSGMLKIELSPELRQILVDLEKIEGFASGSTETLPAEERLTVIRFIATNAAERLRTMFGDRPAPVRPLEVLR